MRFAISKHLNDILILCMKIAFDVCQYGCGFLFRQLWRMEKWHHAGSGNGNAEGHLGSLRRNVQSIEERPSVLRQNIIKWYLALHHKYTFVSTKYVFHQNVLEIKITTITKSWSTTQHCCSRSFLQFRLNSSTIDTEDDRRFYRYQYK